MIRRPPRSTLDRSSAASDVYKRQGQRRLNAHAVVGIADWHAEGASHRVDRREIERAIGSRVGTVSYTHLRAHETVLDLVCRLLLEKKNSNTTNYSSTAQR